MRDAMRALGAFGEDCGTDCACVWARERRAQQRRLARRDAWPRVSTVDAVTCKSGLVSGEEGSVFTMSAPSKRGKAAGRTYGAQAR
jgi:hypothetical protein